MIPLVIIGKGTVGAALLGQIVRRRAALAARGLDLRVVAVAGRITVLIDAGGISDEVLSSLADGDGRSMESARPHAGWNDLTLRIAAMSLGSPIIVDATADRSTDAHIDWIRRGWRVVTANKKPVADTMAAFEFLAGPMIGGLPRYRFEATCGAGLPVISSVGDLLETGDEILEIRAAVSGTLGFLFSACEAGEPFAAGVTRAKASGFTEPDPRDDLSGADVARKALILARLIGLRLEPSDIAAENLVPENLRAAPLDVFTAGLRGTESDIDRRFRDARLKGATLRYLATIAPGQVRVGIEEVEGDSPFGSLKGPENMFVIRSRRYSPAPLVIRGPGAGAEVTAAGVFGDILRFAHQYIETKSLSF